MFSSCLGDAPGSGLRHAAGAMSQHNAITVEASRSEPHDSNNPVHRAFLSARHSPSSPKPHSILSALLMLTGEIAAVEDRQSTPLSCTPPTSPTPQHSNRAGRLRNTVRSRPARFASISRSFSPHEIRLAGHHPRWCPVHHRHHRCPPGRPGHPGNRPG